MQPTWLTAVRERLLEFYSDYTSQFINMFWHWIWYKFLMVGTIFIAKVNTVLCMCTAALPLGQRVDDWLHSLAFIERITDAYSQ